MGSLRTQLGAGLVGVAVVCGGIFSLAWWIGGDNPSSTAIQGDQLGIDNDQSLADYRDYARDTLDQAVADSPEQRRFGLVSFQEALSPSDAAELLKQARRVNAVITVDGSIIELPEPSDNSRAEVMTRYLDYYQHDVLSGVVIWESARTAQAIAGDERVLAVELTDPDAVWSRFGISPVLESSPGQRGN